MTGTTPGPSLPDPTASVQAKPGPRARPAALLLTAVDPPPVQRMNDHGGSDMLLLIDHAGRAVPAALGRLGLPDAEFERHIAWDIGVLGVGRELSDLLDAAVIAQRYSRLVIDCNRTPGHPTSIAPRSDGTNIPANRGPANLDLDQPARDARRDEIFLPYQNAIAAEIDARIAAGRPPILIAIHSFTPVMAGRARPWHVGLLYNHDTRLGRALLTLLQQDPALVVGDNEPYALSDDDDYTIPVHGERRGLLCVELEIRQDLIATPAGERDWAERLARLLPRALAACMEATPGSATT